MSLPTQNVAIEPNQHAAENAEHLLAQQSDCESVGKLSSSSQLTDKQKQIADVWVRALYKNNRDLDKISTEAGFNAAREHVWGLVFNGWDTDAAIRQPGRAHSRSSTKSTFKIATLLHDAPYKSSEKLKPGDDEPAIPEHRRAGSPVYIRVHPNWARIDMEVFYCDASGDQIGGIGQDVEIERLPGTTAASVWGECVLKWDSAELAHVGQANTAWVVFCLRVRLCHSMKPSVDINSPTVAGNETFGIDDNADLDKIQYINLCADLLKFIGGVMEGVMALYHEDGAPEGVMEICEYTL